MESFCICRIRISVSFPGNVNSEVQPQNLFPLYVLLAQPDSDTNNLEVWHASGLSIYYFSIFLIN